LKNDKESPPDVLINDIPWEWVGPLLPVFGGFVIGITGMGIVCCICKLSKNRNKNKHKYKRLSIGEERFDDIAMQRRQIFDSDDEDHEIPNPLEELRKERERSCNIIKEDRGEDVLTKSIELLKQKREDTPVTLDSSIMFFNRGKNLHSKQKNDVKIQKINDEIVINTI